MVDLVKIRKKAKQEEARAEAAREAKSAAPDTEPVVAAKAPAVAAPAKAAAKKSPAPAPPSDIPAAAQAAVPVAAPALDPPPDAPRPPVAPAAGPSKLDRFKEIAGLRRDGLVHERGLADEGERVEVLTFAISGEHYAAGIERVVEIIPLREATRVPNADPAVRGIISLRGRIVTIMDARARLGHPSVASGPDSRIIVVERGSETLGFEVDRVLRVVKVETSEIEPQPVVHTSEEREPIRGVFRQATALTILLDLDKLLA